MDGYVCMYVCTLSTLLTDVGTDTGTDTDTGYMIYFSDISWYMDGYVYLML